MRSDVSVSVAVGMLASLQKRTLRCYSSLQISRAMVRDVQHLPQWPAWLPTPIYTHVTMSRTSFTVHGTSGTSNPDVAMCLVKTMLRKALSQAWGS